MKGILIAAKICELTLALSEKLPLLTYWAGKRRNHQKGEMLCKVGLCCRAGHSHQEAFHLMAKLVDVSQNHSVVSSS